MVLRKALGYHEHDGRLIRAGLAECVIGVDHAPVIRCFICPVLGAASSFIEGIAMLVDFMLRTGGDSCQSSKTEEETKHDRSDGDAEDCWED